MLLAATVMPAGPAPVSAVVRPVIEPMAVPSPPTAAGQQPQAWSEDAPWAFDPQQISTAYGFDAVGFGSGAGDGAGQTIAIVDAYDDPALVDGAAAGFSASDLARFDQQYGLPDPPSFVKVNESGGTGSLPGLDPVGAGVPGNWEQEESLDVEWAHALAPAASIVLVECNSSNSFDLYDGARTAAALPGVSVVSMSWGSAEYEGEGEFDGDFTTPEGHQGVTFVASTGDMGAPGLYPAYSPGVLAVGGTTLTLAADGSYGGESGWSGGGGGTSIIEAAPAFQQSVQATGRRTIPDVAFDADPQTGVSVYDSYDDVDGAGPWIKSGGTSLSAPAWAALIAIADQGRTAAGGATLDGAEQVLPVLYALSAGDFHDVTSGGNGVFGAGPGYDESTGLGSPSAGLVVPALAYSNLAPWLAIGQGPPTVATAGEPFAITVEVENTDGSLDTNYAGSVTISLGIDPGGAGLGGTLTEPVQGGYAVFTGLTLTHAAEGYTILAVTGGGPAAATSAPFAVVPAAPAQIVVDPSPTSPGVVSIAVVDSYGNLETSFAGSVTVQWSNGGGPSGPAHHHAKLSETASDGVVTLAHLKPVRRRILQASADGVTASAILARSNHDALRVIEKPAHTGHGGAKPAALRGVGRRHDQRP